MEAGSPDVSYLDTEKRSPLHLAAYRGSREVVEILIVQVALHRHRHNHHHLLHHLLHLLHQGGARVNTKDNRWLTPLHRACASKVPPPLSSPVHLPSVLTSPPPSTSHLQAGEVVEVLLHHQADVNARDKYWRTPFHVAAASNSLGCAAALLARLANINITDRAGRSGLHHAAYCGHREMVELLVDRWRQSPATRHPSPQGSECERGGQAGAAAAALGGAHRLRGLAQGARGCRGRGETPHQPALTSWDLTSPALTTWSRLNFSPR